MKSFLLLYLSIFLTFSCSREIIPSVAREDRFTMEFGRLEDELDLFSLENSAHKTTLAMRDGLFYIANGSGQKLLRFTSYGDLLFMIYNEETNPPPLTLRTNALDAQSVTRWAYSYPLLSPGNMAVDAQKHIYVEDRLPPERHSYDPENKALLDSLALHFDENGRFLEYLGQEGIGGTPFPRISGLYTSLGRELAVVCRNSGGWNIYWFDENGAVIYLIHLPNNMIPIPEDRPEVFPSVDAVMASPDARKLFIKVDYYREIVDESTNTQSGPKEDSSVIWIMDVETGSYVDTIEVPFFEHNVTEGNRRSAERLFYAMLGVISNDRVFLSFPVENGYSLLILTARSLEQRRALIQVDPEELQYNAFSLSEEGILSGLLADSVQGKIVWWRTDRLAGEIAP